MRWRANGIPIKLLLRAFTASDCTVSRFFRSRHRTTQKLIPVLRCCMQLKPVHSDRISFPFLQRLSAEVTVPCKISTKKTLSKPARLIHNAVFSTSEYELEVLSRLSKLVRLMGESVELAKSTSLSKLRCAVACTPRLMQYFASICLKYACY
jgi:hypothetical protein